MGARFIDTVKVRLKAGDGGRGCVAFRREKYIPRGGPAGGDGGNGGNIIFRADPDIATLLDFRYQPFMKAGNGRPGMGDKRKGKNGDHLVLRVPPGTVIKDVDTGEIIADLVDIGQEVVVVHGGRGGRGNVHFATSTNRAPRRYEDGTPGEERWVELELKSIAEVGLVGFPNAGKSTLLRAISNATPEVGDYPFTTLTPHLGVVEPDGFVVADIPGLIHGASEGKGLGREFLRHIERTSILLYVIDAKPLDGDPVKAFLDVRREVLSYNPVMSNKQSLIALNKIDLLESEKDINSLKNLLQEVAQTKVFPISADKKAGLDELIKGISAALEKENSENFRGL